MRKLCIVFCLLSTLCLADSAVWRANYEKGLGLAAQGLYEEAVSYLQMSVADKPISEIIPDGKSSFEYLPYLQIGICYYHLNKPALAKQFFQLENSLAAISSSKGGKSLMSSYTSKVNARSNGAAPQEDVIRNFEPKPYVLAETEVQNMKDDIRQKCELPRASEETYPWYYHYELGLAFEGKKDWQRALDSFIAALDHRDQPQRFSRIYGMWYIDYYPYYNIGVAHLNLQNWQCATNAFKLSQMFEDLPRSSPQFRNLQDYLSEAEQNAMQNK